MNCRTSSDLPVPAGPRISVLEPLLDAAAEQLVELGNAAADELCRSNPDAVLGRRPGAGRPARRRSR